MCHIEPIMKPSGLTCPLAWCLADTCAYVVCVSFLGRGGKEGEDGRAVGSSSSLDMPMVLAMAIPNALINAMFHCIVCFGLAILYRSG